MYSFELDRIERARRELRDSITAEVRRFLASDWRDAITLKQLLSIIYENDETEMGILYIAARGRRNIVLAQFLARKMELPTAKDLTALMIALA